MQGLGVMEVQGRAIQSNVYIYRNTGRQCQGGLIDKNETISGNPGSGVDDFQV